MKKKNGRQNYDWDSIKLDYISDPKSSLKKIAEKYGIRIQTVEKRSTADNWYAEKKQYQKSLAAEVTGRVYATQADLLEQELRATNMLSEIILTAMQDPQQFNRHLVINSMGETEERIFYKADSRAMLDMVKAVKMIVDIKKSILGITSIEHQNRMDIAREKLQLERDRLEFEKQRTEYYKPDKDIVIRIEGFEEEWSR